MNNKFFKNKNEMIRKLIHISSAIIPIGYYFSNKEFVLLILIPLVCAMIFVEILKYKVDFVYNLYSNIFGKLLRDHEYDRSVFRINGASWVLIGDIISIIIFPKLIAITGMLLLSLADSISAIIGKNFGKKYYAPNRSYIGSMTFLIVGILIVLFTPKYYYNITEYVIGSVAVFLTTITDALSLPADDNLFIPIISCAFLYILYILFFPTIFTFKLF